MLLKNVPELSHYQDHFVVVREVIAGIQVEETLTVLVMDFVALMGVPTFAFQLQHQILATRGEYFGKIWKCKFQGRNLFAIRGHSENFRSPGPPGAEIWPCLCWPSTRPGPVSQKRSYLSSC